MLDYRDYPELSAEFIARHPLDDPRFEPWLEAWYGCETDSKSDSYPDEETVTFFIARAWMLGTELTQRFSLESIGRNLGEHLIEIDWYALFPQGGRIVWDAAYQLYTNIFEPNVGHSLGYLNEGNEFETRVYMFWDAARWYPGAPSVTDRQKADFLRICQRALDSTKASVQESALHGLGHATVDMSEARQAIIRFLRKGKPRRKELRSYAEAALTDGIN